MKMISVVVPVHNTRLYIKECLDSILNQTYSNLEVICIDSSTDETTEILKELADKDSRVKVILDENSSYGYKVNTGIRQAQGEFISIVDSDDYLELNMYERLLDTLIENDADFVKSDHSSFYVEDGENVIIEYHADLLDSELYGQILDCKKMPSLLSKTNISIWSGLYKKEFLWDNSILLNESEGASFQDTGFSILTHIYGRRIFYLNESFYRYRTDNVNSSVKSQKKYRTIADEWEYIEEQVTKRGIADAEMLTALRIRKVITYEWNYERLEEESAKEFAESINDELETQYIDADVMRKMPIEVQEMFVKVYEKGIYKTPRMTLAVMDLLKNRKVALVGLGELGRRIAAYDIENRYFGIQKFYDDIEEFYEGNVFFLAVDKISTSISVEDIVYLIADEGDGESYVKQLLEAGIKEEQISKCTYFYPPEKKELEAVNAETGEIKVSIVVPVYNVEQYLEECLESLLNQTMDQFEVICVDDGSTDGSLAILERMQSLDSRIKVVMQSNQGQAAARNTGIKYAQGKYILFCDSDDMLAVNAVERLYALAEENGSEIVMFDAKCAYMTEELARENKKDFYYQRSFAYGVDTGKEMFTRMTENKNFCDSACLMYMNRKWLEESGLSFYAGSLYEDCLFSVQCMMKADRVYHTNQQYYIYRVRGGSTMTSCVGAANIYGRLINLHFVHKMLLEEQFTDRQENALVGFARTLWYHAQRLARELDINEVEKLLQMPLTHFMKLELEQFGVSSELIRRNSQKVMLEKKLEEAKAIEIYGAGVRGHRLLTYLHFNGYGEKVSNFVVSTKGNQPTKIDGISVLAVDEGWKPCEEKLLIVAFAGDEASKLVEFYKNRGVMNILHLDGDVYCVVSEDIRKKLMM